MVLSSNSLPNYVIRYESKTEKWREKKITPNIGYDIYI